MRITDLIRKGLACILPQSEGFFILLKEQVASFSKACAILDDIADQKTLLPEWYKEIRTIEEECDSKTRAVHEKLQTQFITPIDREDISRLTKTIDDAMDLIDEAVRLTVTYRIDFEHDLDDDMRSLFRTASTSMRHVQKAVLCLGNGFDDISVLRGEMRAFEHRADDLYERIQGTEYDLQINAILHKKSGEILRIEDCEKILEAEMRLRKRVSIARRLEDAVDGCKGVFDVLNDVYLKHT